MIIGIIYLVVSFILDNFMSNIFSSTLTSISYFTTIYIIISFVIIYPYFANEKKYYLLLIIFGLFFDILYTSTFIFNMIIFFSLGIVIKMLNNIFPENLFTTNLMSISVISSYHILSFIILSLVGSIHYDFMLLINIITHSIIMTIIYTSISYFTMKFIFSKFNIKQIK